MQDPGTVLHVSHIPVMCVNLRSLLRVTCAVRCSQHVARSYQGTAAPKLCAAWTVQKYGCHPRPSTRQGLFPANYAECRYLGLATVCARKDRLKPVTSFTFTWWSAYECQGYAFYLDEDDNQQTLRTEFFDWLQLVVYILAYDLPFSNPWQNWNN
jgi:hypothetical protein